MTIKTIAIHFFSFRLETLFITSALTLTTFANAFSQASLAELKDSILTARELYFDKASPGVDAVTDFNGYPEFWAIDQVNTHTQAFRISRYLEEVLYTELYLVQGKKLIYAIEEIKTLPFNLYAQFVWRCEYFIKDDKVIDYISLGHGKTENNHWDPDEILLQFNTRKAELEKIRQG